MRVILTCFCLVCCFCIAFSSSAQANNTQFGQSVTTSEGYTITPISIRVSDGTVNHNAPANGKLYFICCFEITNGSSSEYSFMFIQT